MMPKIVGELFRPLLILESQSRTVPPFEIPFNKAQKFVISSTLREGSLILPSKVKIDFAPSDYYHYNKDVYKTSKVPGIDDYL
jgi:hypothetical protein